MSEKSIRNFVIIAHIDHGKSTLADRMLEVTGTVEARRMRPQYLDQLELERERGITIKMAPVRMRWQNCELNLIDTPGHSDFAYEVSRALAAVEGAILLVDITKGIQAQTLSNLRAARAAGLTILGAVNKIDLNLPQVEKVVQAVADLLEVPFTEIFRISGKTGLGVEELLDSVVRKVPPPRVTGRESQALIFDSLYDEHKGILAFVRLMSGGLHASKEIASAATGAKFKIKEIGGFFPELRAVKELAPGEIGYVATGLKEPDLVKIGDALVEPGVDMAPLAGYREPAPVVFISFYPDSGTEFDDLKLGLAKLRLSDPALYVEPESNEALGRGLKVGFLGQLHFEITTSRLQDEFNLNFLTSFPSVAYRVEEAGKTYVIRQAKDLPDRPEAVFQPMIRLEVLAPSIYLNQVMSLANTFDFDVEDIQTLGESTRLVGRMPLAELIRDFDDTLKSITAGFASFNYELIEPERAEVAKLEILIAGDIVEALTRVVPLRDIEKEARVGVEKLKNLLPKQQFTQAIQAKVGGRIIARETIAAMRKDVTGYLYGGDRSRKMKLWKKQQRGKERLKSQAKVHVPVEVFREILKK